MVEIGQTTGFTIDHSVFLRNSNAGALFPYPMFSVSQSENVTVTNTLFKDNIAGKLIDGQDAALFFDKSNTFRGNTFNAIP